MGGASPAAFAVVRGVERLLDDAHPRLLQPQRSWVRTKGRGWPPSELMPPPEVPPGVLPGWAECEVGIRIGHDTDVEADITVGIGAHHAIVARLGGRSHFSPREGAAAGNWIDEAVEEVSHGLHAEYVWERQFRGSRCVRSELGCFGMLDDGARGRHMVRGFRTRTAWLRLPRLTRVERRVVTYALRNQPG